MASTFGYTTAAKVRGLLTKIVSAVMLDPAVEAHISNAENVVNSKVGAKYSVPFTTVPGIIETLTTELAAYYVMRTQYTQDGQNKSSWTESYERAMSQLNGIRDGKEVILTAAGAEVTKTADDLKSNTSGYVPTFDMDEPEDAAVSPTRLDDIATEREADD